MVTDNVQLNNNCYMLLTILRSHCPTGQEQEYMTTIYNDLRKANTPIMVERRLTEMLLDGLAYGNWPWLV